MPAEPYRFHLHTIEEIDVACRIWGAPGVRAMLGVPKRSVARVYAEAAPDQPAQQHVERRRGGLGWLRLLRAPHAAVR